MLDHEELGLVDLLVPVVRRQFEERRDALGVEVRVLLLGSVLKRELLGMSEDGRAREERKRKQTHSWW